MPHRPALRGLGVACLKMRCVLGRLPRVTGSTRRDVAVSAVVGAGLLLLVWATVSGPPQLFRPSGLNLAPRFLEPAEPTSPAPPAPTPDPHPLRILGPRSTSPDLHWVGELLLWTGVLVLALGIALGVAWLRRHRWHPPERPAACHFDALPDAAGVSAALLRDAGARITAIGEGSPRNAVVECWLGLEQAVADAGLPRAPWETSAEFTLRVLKALDVDPRALATLARLFREARFSEHELGEESRAAAREALQQLYVDLGSPPTAAPGTAS